MQGAKAGRRAGNLHGMETDRIIEDKELGQLRVLANKRARRITFKVKPDAIRVTVPPGTSRSALGDALRQLRPRLREAYARQRRPPIVPGYRIDAECFRLSLESGAGKHFLARSEPGRMQIVCPSGADFADAALQAWLRKAVVEALRRQAKLFLPQRLDSLARRHGLAYRQAKVNSSAGRWGSCSGKQGINLSCYLMLLPLKLIDYVLLHELAHTREMNHGPAFWSLLDRLTGGQAMQLRKELKQHQTRI